MSRDETGFLKQKNLLDLKYQTYLNYFNIAAISFITIGFTAVWAFILQEISWHSLLLFGFIWAPITVVAMTAINRQLKVVYSEIEMI